MCRLKERRFLSAVEVNTSQSVAEIYSPRGELMTRGADRCDYPGGIPPSTGVRDECNWSCRGGNPGCGRGGRQHVGISSPDEL
jgi:hypothetical protein